MTPKGAAVLPRPFCCHFAFWRGRFSEPFFAFLPRRFCRPFCCLAAAVLPPSFYCFPSPLSPSSCSPRPATFCELLPAPMVTFCELFANFCLRPLWQSWHFVNFWRHFAHPLSTACKLFANFCTRPVLAKLAFCQLLATLCALAARLLSPSVPISAVFPFFANFNFTSAGL